MRFRLAALPFALVFAAGPLAASALAEEPHGGKAACSVEMIHARPDGDGSIDPQLTSVREDLKKPPFTAWKTFKLLDRKSAELAEGKSASFPTPDGNSFGITFTGHVLRPGGKHAIKAALDVPGARSSAKTQITLDEGGHMVIAGVKHQGGILIYAVSCKTEQ